MKNRLIQILIGLVVFVIILFGSAIVRLYTDWMWFQEIGYEGLFLTPIKAQLAIGTIVSLATFVLLFLNISIATDKTSKKSSSFKFIEGKIQVDATKYTKPIAIAAMALISLLTAFVAGGNWETVLQYFNATPFNKVDPIFNTDISFYFFSIPFLQIILAFITWIILVSFATAVALYGSSGSISKSIRSISLNSKTNAHLSILATLFFAVSAIRIWYIKIPNLLYSTTGPFTGASYTDLNASMPLLKFLAILAGLVSLILLFNVFKRAYFYAAGAIGTYILISIVGGIYPLAIQKFVVDPNELVKESPSLIRNINATRTAFGLDKVEERDLLADENKSLSKKDIEDNKSTINNIRLWDREPLLDTFGQLQEIRTYYDFASIDNDRYEINGEYRQVLLSPRELNADSLPSESFINKSLTFTHGYGVTLSPVNEVTPEGLPLLFVKDIPPASNNRDIQITRPEIYYGELVHEPVFVNTKAQEFNYPSGDENVFSDYAGSGGVPIKNIMRKAFLALRFGSLKIILSNDITSDSKVMYYRNIKNRVNRALPFLKFDRDPYMVITEDGQLNWIYDAYTTSNRYPYSERIIDKISGSNYNTFSTLNYIRNSVKVVINAYDGSMKFYISDPSDPIINTYEKVFPNVFSTMSDLPKDLIAHLRYPEDLFSYQSALYQTYHMKEPQIFYNKEDEWQIPRFGSSGDPMMRHLIMKLPEEEKEEFILMLPFTPREKDNMAAWMVARADGDNYGKLVVYRFPKQKLVFGPKQIVDRINQDAEISSQISLWDQKGSQVIRGNLLVIPIEESLLYVQPLYIKADGGRIPELKRIIVAYENQIAMSETLDVALEQIFSGVRISPSSSGAQSITQPDLIKQAQTHYNNATNAQKNGNWSLYGEELKKLGEVLRRIR